MKFLVDKPLEGLAKWLRFSGFDARSAALSTPGPPGLPDPAADTHLLTRQISLDKLQRPDIIVLVAEGPEEQLEEVFQRLKISPRDLSPLSRCARCNERLARVEREAAQGEVPEHIFLTQKEFYRCPVCRRLYWPGSHLPGIGRTLARAAGRRGKAK